MKLQSLMQEIKPHCWGLNHFLFCWMPNSFGQFHNKKNVIQVKDETCKTFIED